jgi:DNA integrity scanning protein DisA with diadenylate cyclase activity
MESIKTFFDKIVGALMSFSFPSDLLDVILVAFIIYEAIKLMRGSRTSQIIKGIF